MAEPLSLSSYFRRLLVWVAVGLAVALIAREVRKQPPGAGYGASPSEATPLDEQLANLVPDLVTALGRGDGTFVMDHVSPGFKEERGLDYYDVRSLVEMAALTKPPLAVRLDQLELTPLGDGHQLAVAKLSFARGQRLAPDGPLPDGAVRYAVEVVFAKQGPRWLALTGTYRRESPAATEPATPPTATR